MAYPGYDTFCRYCGKPIIFIRTGAGKLMPCDATPVKYWRAEDGGGILIYQRDGSSIKGRLCGHDAACAGSGYVPHWTSCTNRPKPKREERPPTPGELKIREQIARERAKREARAAKRAEREAEEAALREAEAMQERLF